LGAPSEEDLSFITDKSAIAYINEFLNHHVASSPGLMERLPYASV
jgi:hypothetical protein